MRATTTPTARAAELLGEHGSAARAVWCAAFGAHGSSMRAVECVLQLHGESWATMEQFELVALAADMHTEIMRAPTASTAPSPDIAEDFATVREHLDGYRVGHGALMRIGVSHKNWKRNHEIAAEHERAAEEARDAALAKLAKLQADVKHHVDADTAELVEQLATARADLERARAELAAARKVSDAVAHDLGATERKLHDIATLAKALCDALVSAGTVIDGHGAGGKLRVGIAHGKLLAAADAVLGGARAAPFPPRGWRLDGDERYAHESGAAIYPRLDGGGFWYERREGDEDGLHASTALEAMERAVPGSTKPAAQPSAGMADPFTVTLDSRNAVDQPSAKGGDDA